jgi:drug/metabolite transporter (DMT)-like permease
MAAIFVVTLWAAWIPITRLSVTTSLGPIDLAALRFFTSGLLLSPLMLRTATKFPWRRPMAMIWLIGGAGTPYILTFGYGLKIANSGQAGVLGPGAMSIFVAIIAAVALKEAVPKQRWLGIAIGLVGIMMIVVADLTSGGVRLESYLLILCAGSLWAAHTVASRALALPPLTTTTYVCVINGLLLMPYYACTGGFARLANAPRQDVWIQIIFQGVVIAIIALLAYAFAVRRLGASATAVFPPLTPVFAGIIGYVMLGDTLDPSNIIGLILVFTGVVIAARA